MVRGVLFGIFIGLVAIGSLDAETIYVPDDYPTIQGAINAAVNGDMVIVRPGIYNEAIDFLGKTVAVESLHGTDLTWIDGTGLITSVVSFGGIEGPATVLQGFTITGGSGSLHGSQRYGGGMYCDCNPTIIDCVFTGNTADLGGGIYCGPTSYVSNPILINCTVSGNTATDEGGGMYIGDSDPTMTACTITNNTAGSRGGGLMFGNDNFTTMGNCTISGNQAGDDGGGMFCVFSFNMIITNCSIVANRALDEGGGMFKDWDTYITLTNCIFWGNSDVGGMDESAQIHVYNSSNPTINYSCVQGWTGGFGGTGNIDAYPLFVDPVNGDFHLTWQSPCKNTGDNLSVLTQTDFEGDPRIHDGTVDIGADEFHTHLYHMGTVTPGGKIQVKVIGNPVVTPVTLALGSGVQDPPQSTPYGDLYLILPPVRTFNLGGIPSNGVLVYPATVPASWQTGDEYPFQALLGPLAPGSVLTNLMPLTVE